MVLNDLVDSFCYSQKNAGLKGLIHNFKTRVHIVDLQAVAVNPVQWHTAGSRQQCLFASNAASCRCVTGRGCSGWTPSCPRWRSTPASTAWTAAETVASSTSRRCGSRSWPSAYQRHWQCGGCRGGGVDRSAGCRTERRQQPAWEHSSGFVQTFICVFPGLSRTWKDQTQGFSRTQKSFFQDFPGNVPFKTLVARGQKVHIQNQLSMYLH